MSWAEDEGMDGYDSDDFMFFSTTKEYEWEDKEHHTRLIHDLDSSHIRNIVKKMKRDKRNGTTGRFWGQGWKQTYMECELVKRSQFPNKGEF